MRMKFMEILKCWVGNRTCIYRQKWYDEKDKKDPQRSREWVLNDVGIFTNEDIMYYPTGAMTTKALITISNTLRHGKRGSSFIINDEDFEADDWKVEEITYGDTYVDGVKV
jgi:hypothetical protein